VLHRNANGSKKWQDFQNKPSEELVAKHGTIYYQILFVTIRWLCCFASRWLSPLPLNSFSRWRRRAKGLNFVVRRWVTQPGSQSTA